MDTKYHAFISYSQKEDRNIADALQKGLRQLGAKKYLLKFRALEIFRDETHSSGTKGLKNRIYIGIDQSEYLLLLACPEITRQPTNGADINWVQEEIEYWISSKHRLEYPSPGLLDNPKVIICITDGSIRWDKTAGCVIKGNPVGDFDWNITNCLPLSLKGRFSFEPQWVDMRDLKTKSKENPSVLTLEYPRFKQKVAEISAIIQGTSVDELIAEDRQIKRYWTGTFALAALLLLMLSITSVVFLIQSKEKEKQARKSEAKAKDNETEANRQRDIAKEALKREIAAKDLETQARLDAEVQKKEAVNQKEIAINQAYSNAAYAFADRDPTVAVNFAMKALAQNDNNTAKIALIKAFNTGSWFYSHQFKDVNDADISKDGHTVVTTGFKGTKLIDLKSNKSIELGIGASCASFLPTGNVILWNPWHGRDRAGSISFVGLDGKLTRSYEYNFNSLKITSNGSVLVPIFKDKKNALSVIDPVNGAELEYDLPNGFDMLYGLYDYLDCKNAYIVCGGIFSNNQIEIIYSNSQRKKVDVPSGYEVNRMSIYNHLVALYLVGGSDKKDALGVIDLNYDNIEKGIQVIELRKVDYGDKGGKVEFVDSTHVVAASTDGWICLLDLNTKMQNYISGFRAADNIKVSPDKKTFAVAKRSGEVFFYNLNGVKVGQLLGPSFSDGLNAAFQKISFDNNGLKVITVNRNISYLWQRPKYNLVSRPSKKGNSNGYLDFFNAFVTKMGGPEELPTLDNRDTRKVGDNGEVSLQFKIRDQTDFIQTGLTKDDLYKMKTSSEGKVNDWAYVYKGSINDRIFILSPDLVQKIVAGEMAAKRVFQIDKSTIRTWAKTER